MDFSIVKNQHIEEELKKIYKEEQELNNHEPMARPQRDPANIRALEEFQRVQYQTFQRIPIEPDQSKIKKAYITGLSILIIKNF